MTTPMTTPTPPSPKRLVTLMFHDVYRTTPDESGFRGPGADRYKMSLQRFRQHLDAIAAVRADAPVLLVDSGQDAVAAAPMPYAISVDDGGVAYLDQVAPCLDEKGWRGHCLVTTAYLGKPGFLHPNQVRELHEAGHVIGSHSHTHPTRFHTLGFETLVDEWHRSRAILEDIIGGEVVIGSVPGGYYSRTVRAAAAQAGIRRLFNSEPVTTVQRDGECEVYGRLTLRRDSAPALSGQFLRSRSHARWRQWTAWNGKKALKAVLGPGYARLGNRVGTRQN